MEKAEKYGFIIWGMYNWTASHNETLNYRAPCSTVIDGNGIHFGQTDRRIYLQTMGNLIRDLMNHFEPYAP